ncbi:MAG: hypothetical protein KJ718_02000 [Nanoarchaeota archaeon]|nr:hypothetical protein [Nanoarchaeota archaeon]MBU1051307.1 hypothetical protein [Nanoarchaeota archaeon]
MKSLYGAIGVGLVSLPLLFGGCESSDTPSNNAPSNRHNQPNLNQNVVETRKTYFTSWGFLDELELVYMNKLEVSPATLDDLEISLGDMDGDCDLDIVVGSRATGLRIYENRIPQKNR